MSAEFASKSEAIAHLVKPEHHRLVLLEDRYTAHGDMVTAALAYGEVMLHIATETGTADVFLDAEMATRIARALLDGARRLEPEEWRTTAAYRMIHDAYEADWQASDGEPF